jgi:hypothetical protein
VTSQGTAHGRFTRALATRNLREAEIAARELGQLSLDDALKLCVLLAERDPPRFERAALRWLERFMAERLCRSRPKSFSKVFATAQQVTKSGRGGVRAGELRRIARHAEKCPIREGARGA